MSFLEMLFGDNLPTSTSFPVVPLQPANLTTHTQVPVANYILNQHDHHPDHHHAAMHHGSENEETKVKRHNHSYFDHLDEMPEELRDFINQKYNLNLVMKSIDIDEETNWDNATGNYTDPGFFMAPWKEVLDEVVTYVMTINVVGIMLGMGCAIYWREVISNLWPPIGILIGMCGQFLLLPATAFGFSILFKLTPSEAIGCLVVSCSPGGSFSNFFTFWVEGDLALSVVMTSCSSVIAFVGMPFNLWMYSSYYVGEDANNIVIPYSNIMMSLVFICGPVIIGMVIRHFSMKVARVITKITSIVGYVGFVVVLTSWLVLFWEVFLAATPLIYASAIILPVTGFSVAYIVALLLRQSHKVCRTIGIETGSQNMPVALSIILLSFEDPRMRSQMILFPTLYGVFMLVEVFSGIGVYRVVKICQDRRKARRDSATKQYPLSHSARYGNGTTAEKEKLNA